MSTQTHRTGRLKTALTISFLFVSHVLPLTEPEIKTIIRDQVTSFFNALTGAQRDSIPYNTFRRQCSLKLHPDKPISHPTTGRDLTPEEKTETANFFNGVFPQVAADATFSRQQFFRPFFDAYGVCPYNFGGGVEYQWFTPAGQEYTFKGSDEIGKAHFPQIMINDMVQNAQDPKTGVPWTRQPAAQGGANPQQKNNAHLYREAALAKGAFTNAMKMTAAAAILAAFAGTYFFFTSRSRKEAATALFRLIEDVTDNNNVSLLDRLNAVRIRNINSYKSVDGTNKKRASIDAAYKNLVRTPRMKKIANDFGFSEDDMLVILPLYLAYRDAGGRQALARNILIAAVAGTALSGGYSYYRHRAHTIARNAIPVPQPPAGAPIPAPVPAPAPAPNPIHIPSAFGCPNVVLPNGQTIPDVD